MLSSKAGFKLCLLVRQMCDNCTKCDKGFKIGTNEAYINVKIKIRVGGILKTLWFGLYTNMAASDKGILLKRKMLENVFASRIKRNQWKELTKLIWNDLGTILIEWMVCWDIWPEKYAKATKSASFWHFCEIQNDITQERSPRPTSFMVCFQSVFRGLFSCGICIVNKQDKKNMFLRHFDTTVKSLCPE